MSDLVYPLAIPLAVPQNITMRSSLVFQLFLVILLICSSAQAASGFGFNLSGDFEGGIFKNSALGISSRAMTDEGLEGLPGFYFNEQFFLGATASYRFGQQQTSHNNSEFNAAGNSWLLGPSLIYNFNSQWALQGTAIVAGNYKFGNPDSNDIDASLKSPLGGHLKLQFFSRPDLSIDGTLDFHSWKKYQSDVSLNQTSTEILAGFGLTYHLGRKLAGSQAAELEASVEKQAEKPAESLYESQVAPEPTPSPTPTWSAAPAPTNIPIQQMEPTVILNFPVAESKITPDQENIIEDLVVRMKQNPDQKALIWGFTDIQATKKKNILISEQRAKAAKSVFVKNGIDPKRIKAVGKGIATPVSQKKSKTEREKSRRIEIRIGESN